MDQCTKETLAYYQKVPAKQVLDIMLYFMNTEGNLLMMITAVSYQYMTHKDDTGITNISVVFN